MARKFRPTNRAMFACLFVLLLTITVRALPMVQELIYTCSGGFTEELAPPVLLTGLPAVPDEVWFSTFVDRVKLVVDLARSMPAVLASTITSPPSDT